MEKEDDGGEEGLYGWRVHSRPQSPGTAPQTETSQPPPASSGPLWPCSHTERKILGENNIMYNEKHCKNKNKAVYNKYTQHH